MTTLCLTMIVRNESAVIRRCLTSVRDVVDTWVICDTGSTDGTQEIVRSTMEGVPGELHETPWVDFAHNRNIALDLTQGKADYLLLLDADMVLNAPEGFKDELTADSYILRYEGPVDYGQILLVRASLPWRYHGATHEYIEAEGADRQELQGVTISHFADGGTRGDKLERDEALLRKALEDEPDNPRHMFYMAQTCRGLGRLDEALAWYDKRIEAGGWPEEVFMALFERAGVLAGLERDWPSVLDAYLRAYQFRPGRIEPLYEVARRYRAREQFDLGYLFARQAVDAPYPKDILFVQRDIYDHRLLMELAVCAHWTGRFRESIEANNRLLDNPNVPPHYLHSVIRNQGFSVEAQHPPRPPEQLVSNRIKVIVPFFNAGNFLDNCVSSLLMQDYEDFEIVAFDDASTDGSHERIPTDDPRFTLIRNDRRRGGAYNFHVAFTEHCQPDDIVVHVDGDDWLACKDALSYINTFYNLHDCWVMYGQFRFSTGRFGIARPYPSRQAFSKLRSVWYASAIRTFRAGLYHRIAEQDPSYACMKDHAGEWFASAMDQAVMYPVLELAGYDRVRYNHRVLYVYNVQNPLNVHKTRRQEEHANNIEIVNKKPFQPVDGYR